MASKFSVDMEGSVRDYYNQMYDSSAATPISPHRGPNRVQYDRTFKQEELDHEAFKTPVETLSNLWKARFGNEWVKASVFDEDKFFEIAAYRLVQMGRIEHISVDYASSYMLRMPE